jgi:hypothetical protein
LLVLLVLLSLIPLLLTVFLRCWCAVTVSTTIATVSGGGGASVVVCGQC